jgi:hypothetical protein
VDTHVAGGRATRIAKLWVDAVWWVSVVLGSVLTVAIAASPFVLGNGSGVNEIAVRVSLAGTPPPRAVALTSTDTMRATDAVITEREAQHHLEFRTYDPTLFVAAHGVFLLLGAAMVWWIYLLRAILADVLRSKVFTEANAWRLSRMGWVLIVVAVAGPFAEWFRAWIVLARTEFRGAAFTPVSSELISWAALAGLLLLVLSGVWRYGVELQSERELTV